MEGVHQKIGMASARFTKQKAGDQNNHDHEKNRQLGMTPCYPLGARGRG